jgi:hypothetical protein
VSVPGKSIAVSEREYSCFIKRFFISVWTVVSFFGLFRGLVADQ